MIRILVVDADEVWRQGFRRVAEEAGWQVCGETSETDAAMILVVEHEPDVVALDASFPATSIEAFAHRRPESSIVVFGAWGGDQDPHTFLDAGARGLVRKSDSVEIIHQAIESASRKEPFFSPAASELLLERFLRGGPRRLGPRRSTQKLTPRERDVVRLLAEGKTNRELARDLHISVKTVENHRANAMRKLGARSLGDLVRAAIESGVIES